MMRRLGPFGRAGRCHRAGRRDYLVYYRDPIVLGGCPSSSTFNGTQAVTINWASDLTCGHRRRSMASSEFEREADCELQSASRVFMRETPCCA